MLLTVGIRDGCVTNEYTRSRQSVCVPDDQKEKSEVYNKQTGTNSMVNKKAIICPIFLETAIWLLEGSTKFKNFKTLFKRSFVVICQSCAKHRFRPNQLSESSLLE